MAGKLISIILSCLVDSVFGDGPQQYQPYQPYGSSRHPWPSHHSFEPHTLHTRPWPSYHGPPSHTETSTGGTYSLTSTGSPELSSSATTFPTASSTGSIIAVCTKNPTAQHLSDPPYEDYFYSDCHVANQVVVTSPLSDSNLTVIGPRLLVAWPAGASGVVAFFAPQNGINGTLSIGLVGNSSQSLSGVYLPTNSSSLSGNPFVGVNTLVHFNSSAKLTVAILGSIRTIRDFTEGPSLLRPEIQDANHVSRVGAGGAMISRLWLDNITTSYMAFIPTNGSAITINNGTLELKAGTYNFTAAFDYPQLTQLDASSVLNNQSQNLISQYPDQTTSLSFLSYAQKLTTGAWRFLTYFARDSMISLALLQPVLSEGDGGAVEAVISAVLERINRTDGSICHEETIGDYATWLNLQNNVTSTAPGCSYIMVDTDYYLMPAMQHYFLDTAIGRSRIDKFFATKSTLDFGNAGLTYAELARINAEKIVKLTGPFAQADGQVESNLIHLKDGIPVGNWRDSTYGLGGGRIPYDVNTALVPAALRAIAALSADGFSPEHPEWNETAARNAKVWEDETLKFFKVTVPEAEAKELVTSYASGRNFTSHASDITSDVVYHAVALDGNNGQTTVKVMNTDDCFRHFMLNTTNQEQLTDFVNSTAN
ncbi:hypothetical protein K470DRAFT_260328, partial [Piedraia hortae CBS 480.64]